jgi:hypothetical protein
LLASALGSSTLAAQTIQRKEARPIKSIDGVDTFRTLCASCHGTSGKGDGPAAKALVKAPADLRTIAKRHGGTFSRPDVEAFIRGEQDVAAHGSREMPVWGPVLRAISPDDSTVKLRLANLVEYLRSIQTQ